MSIYIIRQIARSNYRLLGTKSVDRCRFDRRIAINGRRRSLQISRSDNWIEQFFPSLHKCSPTLFLPTHWQSGYLLFRPLSRPLYPDLFLPSVTALPSLTRRKINSKNSARSIGPSPGKEANLYVHALDRYRPNFSRLALFATRPRNELPNSRFRSKQGRGSSRV